MIIGIVGSEAAKFTPATEAKARAMIRYLVRSATKVVSGDCHLGGIDKWAEEEAEFHDTLLQASPPLKNAGGSTIRLVTFRSPSPGRRRTLMNEHIFDIGTRLAALLGGSAHDIVEAYTWYMIAASVVWIVFGLLIAWGSFWINRYIHRKVPEINRVEPFYIICGWVLPIIFGFIASIVIFTNLADLSAPRAAAIHQLLKDLHG